MATQYRSPAGSDGGLWLILIDTILLVPVIMAAMFFLSPLFAVIVMLLVGLLLYGATKPLA